MVAVANDVLNQELPEADDSDWKFASSLPRLSQAAPEDVAETLRLLLSTPQRAILAGQGVLYADATQELVQLAELTNTPVATTLNGKSAFPENHPLALGTAARTRPATVARFFERAEVVLGIGTSFTRSLYITPMPPRARLGQIVNVRRGYMGWGKSTQLGTGLGLAMGARLALPDWLSVNVMGDAAFGMVGMDFETAVRCRIPILTIVLNNGLMGGYGEYMPDAVKAHAANRLTGDYTGVAKALGGYAERVTLAGDLAPAIERCAKSVKAGQAALLEVITCEESDLALG